MKSEKNILIAFLLNIIFAIFEFIGGLFTNSIAIISDAVHDLGDALSIGFAFLLEKKSKKEPDEIYTYGYGRYSVLAATMTSAILFSGSLLVIYNAVKRLYSPVPVNYNGMLIFAIVGVMINVFAAYFTKGGNSLNQKAVNLHMLEDALGWIVVLIGAIVMRFTNINIIDPILSIGVSLFILINSIKHFKEVLDLFLEKKPNNINNHEIENQVLNIKGVINIHHLHLWSLDGNNNFATMHVVVKKIDNVIKDKIRTELKKHGISHVTIELENESEICNEESCQVELFTKELHHHHH